MHRFKGTPLEAEVGSKYKDKIMHAELSFSGGKMFASDRIPKTPVGEGNVAILITTDDEAEGLRVFTALAAGATITTPLAEVFWGGKFGMLTDKFGIVWMVSAAHGE